jgi:hypothetical protein
MGSREEYIAERNAAVIAGVDALIALGVKYGKRPSNRRTAEISLHQLRTAIPSLPLVMRKESSEWLAARGYHSWGDDV